MLSDYLIHFGVLGMKWGVRKDRYQTPKGFDKGFNKAKNQLTKADKYKKRSEKLKAKSEKNFYKAGLARYTSFYGGKSKKAFNQRRRSIKNERKAAKREAKATQILNDLLETNRNKTISSIKTVSDAELKTKIKRIVKQHDLNKK